MGRPIVEGFIFENFWKLGGIARELHLVRIRFLAVGAQCFQQHYAFFLVYPASFEQRADLFNAIKD